MKVEKTIIIISRDGLTPASVLQIWKPRKGLTFLITPSSHFRSDDLCASSVLSRYALCGVNIAVVVCIFGVSSSQIPRSEHGPVIPRTYLDCDIIHMNTPHRRQAPCRFRHGSSTIRTVSQTHRKKPVNKWLFTDWLVYPLIKKKILRSREFWILSKTYWWQNVFPRKHWPYKLE